ncbi:hypothetical protein OG369_39820 [Streptomyces sp. NBC_01221]|uniref:hypothetical protein n=1 Tax=Streptomyces sp. NBC_01221 TaxID=2903782 RepID=UPI0022534BB7|nr:hypothetical protein [Streptomyces sp. NBC_01221]MCX4791999.1 hypothetical protein [Streptomyces sp. NBC_01221]
MDSTRSLNRRAWRRWAVLFGLPGAVVALSSVWLYEPESQGMGLVAAGVAVVALLVFVLTMPHRAPDEGRRPRGATPGDIE